MAAVGTKDIRKDFGDVAAVDGVSLSVRDGEFLVLLGPSGCGKTTFLRIIAGLERQTSGDVLINDEIVNDITPRARGVAMVFQSYGLYPHLTVANNIAFPLRTQGTPRPEIKIGPPACSASTACFTGVPASFREASASVWRWPALSCEIQPCSC